MKTRIILVSTLFMLLSACNGDLDIINNSAVSSNSMWQEEGDATAAMYGLYNKFRSSFSEGYMYWGEYRTGLWGDGLTGQTSRDQIYQNQIPTNHTFADWTNLYTTINNANLILKHAQNIHFKTEESKNEVLANAYFVRAFCYYWIGRIWGDAPLLLDGFESDNQEGLFPTRNPADAIFKQVGEDADKALTLISKNINKNIASKASISMLKADYDLWMYKVRKSGDSYLKDAADKVNYVLSNSSYALESNYADVFNDNSGKEIIFEWSYIQDEFTSGSTNDYLVPSQYVSNEYINNPIQTGSHQQWCFYTQEYKTFLTSIPTDQRIKESFETFYDSSKNQTFQWINKFKGHWVNNTRVFDSDVIVYRYADAILMDAEIKLAENNITGAIEALNKIAKRAYGQDNYYATTISAAEVKDAIITERKKEFCAEGKLWWDFIRLGVAFSENSYLKGRENEKNVLLWPISQNSINKNPTLKQTIGYDK
ncbi:RagB/SusD family nutrient uptake outer membrane protein [Hoylesella nanceiensis]|uniref:RagB/SusD family nutrient uptake outer membrane protein n=1 Tax=Hoylesella nanceiensis TaxID=425941 RepID=UPI001CB479CE|nr:RagB/SusD family nutrient uptake outer membrane protein [Hoylesella nanceiensis]MBF1428689.1 RagB/SusD family nutrient uptake outer membrane protein [Hoylesella nanceiensis]